METPAYDSVFVGIDLGALCRREPVEVISAPLIYAHGELPEDRYTSFSQSANEIDIEYRQEGNWSYERAVDEVHTALSAAVEGANEARTREYVEEIIGAADPSTEKVEQARETVHNLLGLTEEERRRGDGLVSREVSDRVRRLSSKGVETAVITDEAPFTGIPVSSHYLGLPPERTVTPSYGVNEWGRFDGTYQLRDKGDEFRGLSRDYDYRIAVIDATRDIGMGEAADASVVVSPDTPVREQMEGWVDRNPDQRILVETPQEAVLEVERRIGGS